MKKLLLIVNPRAGQKKAKKVLADIIDIFNRADFTVITHITSCTGDAENACIRYADQIDQVVCCGGDGTFNETVSGILKSGKDIPIGYIPSGSTNDFATSLQFSTDLLQAARDIVSGAPQRLDIGLFGNRYFSYVASFGIFTRTSYTTSQSMKNVLGRAAYVLNGIQELSQIRSHPLRFTLSDGRCVEDSFLFGAISNSTSVGGVLNLDQDQVDMTDGQLELLLIRAPKDLLELSDCVRALQQKTFDHPLITFLSTDCMTISALEGLSWTIDGEHHIGQTETAVSCLQHAIQVITK